MIESRRATRSKVNVRPITFLWYIILSFGASYAWSWEGELPVPEGVLLNVVGEDMKVNGIPLKAYEYFWLDGEESLLSFYSNYWGGESSASVTNSRMGMWTVISKIDDDYNITIQYRDEGIKGLKVLLGISPLPKMIRLNRKGHSVSKVHPMPGIEIVSVVESVDEGVSSEVYWMSSINSIDKTSDIVANRYREGGFFVTKKNIRNAENGSGFMSYIVAEDVREKYQFSISNSKGKTKIVVARRDK